MMTATHLHAMIIHFPIALLIVGFLSEIIGLFTKKDFFKTAAFFTLWVSIITVLFKSSVYYFKYHKLWVKGIGFLLYVLLVIAVARTGYLGGQLVFSHGAGVELELPDFNN